METKDTLAAVLRDIRQGRAAPCYLLCGEEEFLLEDALRKIVDALLPESDREWSLFVLEGEQESPARLLEILNTPPLLPGRKVLVVRNTRLFQSAATLPQLVRRARDLLDRSPSQSARVFSQFLAAAGLTADDLGEGGWRGLPEEEWIRLAGAEAARELPSWLPRLLENSERHGPAPAASGEGAGRLEELFRTGLPEEACLILTAPAVDRRTRLFKALGERSRVLSFEAVKGESRQRQSLARSVEGLLGEAGKSMDGEALLAVGRKTGFQLRESVQMVEKLIAYVGDRPAIETRDVEEAVGKTREDSVFDLTTALARRDLSRCLLILDDLVLRGEAPVFILAMAARELRNLRDAAALIRSGGLPPAWRAEMEYPEFQRAVYPALRSGGGGGLRGQHPYVIHLALRNARAFSTADLEGLVSDLAAMDLALKSTARSPRHMLERFFLKVCSS